MKAMITGMNGTVAPVLAKSLMAAGHTFTTWDRSQVPTDDVGVIRNFIQKEKPDWFFHLATGSPDWAGLNASICAELGIQFLFTSSVSVYSASQTGPFSVHHAPIPDDDYGRYKLDCELKVQAAHPEAQVARIGWQIGHAAGSNQMVDYLERTHQTQGQINASLHWYQACSFLEDTAESLLQIMEHLSPGLYHVDGNPGLNFHEIVTHLNKLHGNRWNIVKEEAPKLNNRLLDERVHVNPITNHFL